MTPRTPQVVLRIALAAWAVDSRSVLSSEQRLWIAERLRTRAPFTAREVAKLRGPLLAWVRAWMPACESVIAQQFDESREEVERPTYVRD